MFVENLSKLLCFILVPFNIDIQNLISWTIFLVKVESHFSSRVTLSLLFRKTQVDIGTNNCNSYVVGTDFAGHLIFIGC